MDEPRIGCLMMVDDSEADHLIFGRSIATSGLIGAVFNYRSAAEALDHLADPERSGVHMLAGATQRFERCAVRGQPGVFP